MANKIISNLTPKTSPAAADLLAIEDTEATKKIDYNALADAILNKITSKTYSVAGSTQTLISAIDALNSNLTTIVLPQALVSSNADIYAIYDALGNAASFRRRLMATTAFDVLASGRAYVLEGYKNSDNYGYLYLYSYGTPQGSVYSNLKSNGSWSGWQLIPTRAELDSLNSNFGHYWNLNFGTAIPSGADMDDYTTPGVYLTATQAIAQSLSHYPTNRSSKIIVEYQNSTSRIMQTVITTYTPWEIHRRIAEYTNGAYVWRDWYQEPMRDEITSLNNRLAVSLTKHNVDTTGTTFTIPNNYRGTLVVSDSSPSRFGEYIVGSTGAGAVNYKAVLEAADITITTGTNTLTITASAGSRVILFTTIQGAVPTV